MVLVLHHNSKETLFPLSKKEVKTKFSRIAQSQIIPLRIRPVARF